MIPNTITKSILAGISIGIASMMFLKINTFIGAILFSFGLITVIKYKWYLFTGQAGFNTNIKFLSKVLFFNIIGGILVSYLIPSTVNSIVLTRLNNGYFNFLLAIGCGFIMTTSVKFAKENNYLPLLLGVPVFILCGFPHCVADVVYYFSCPIDFLFINIKDILIVYLSTVIGNYIGCNLYKLENI